MHTDTEQPSFGRPRRELMGSYLRWVITELAVGGGWKWLRFMSNSVICCCYYVEPSSS